MSSFENYRNLFDLSGKVALVTGGAGGIGSAISEGLAAFGATVVVCGRTGAKAEALAAQIEALYPGLPNARWVALRLLDGDERIALAQRLGELGDLSRGSLEDRTQGLARQLEATA